MWQMGLSIYGIDRGPILKCGRYDAEIRRVVDLAWKRDYNSLQKTTIVTFSRPDVKLNIIRLAGDSHVLSRFPETAYEVAPRRYHAAITAHFRCRRLPVDAAARSSRLWCHARTDQTTPGLSRGRTPTTKVETRQWMLNVRRTRPIKPHHDFHSVVCTTEYWQQYLSYRKQIERQLCTQYVDGINDNPVTMKCRLRFTQGHWKRNHSVDHTRLTISRVISHWILSWPWNVAQRSLKVIENGTIWKISYGFVFAFHRNNGHIFSHFGYTQRQRNLDLESLKWRRSIDHMRLSIGPPL